MALRSLQKTRSLTGMVLSRDFDGKIPDSEFDRMMYELQLVRTLLNGGLSVGNGSASSSAGNLKAQVIQHIFTAANTLTVIAHGLGVTPVLAIPIFKDRACDIYDTNFGDGWGTKQIQLYCTVASAKVKLLVWA